MAANGTPQSYLSNLRPKNTQADNSMAQDNTSSGNPYGYMPQLPQNDPTQYPNNRYIPPMYNPTMNTWDNTTAYSLPSAYTPNAGGGMPGAPGQFNPYQFTPSPYAPGFGNGAPPMGAMPANYNPQFSNVANNYNSLAASVAQLGLGNVNQATNPQQPTDTYMNGRQNGGTGSGAAMNFSPQDAIGAAQYQAGMQLASNNDRMNAAWANSLPGSSPNGNPMGNLPVFSQLFAGSQGMPNSTPVSYATAGNPQPPASAPSGAIDPNNYALRAYRDRTRFVPNFRNGGGFRSGGGNV